MQKLFLVVEIRFLGKVFCILVGLNILFSDVSLANNSLGTQIKSIESDLKVGEPKDQKLSGVADLATRFLK